MTQPLSPADAANLQQASAAGVATYLDRVRPHIEAGRWLGVRNVYRRDPVARIRSEFDAGARAWPLQLGDYVAVSAPLHLWDGWNYLGKALDAHVRGSADVTRHLAYYAELRAAMALLATQGVGIFNRRHCVVDAGGAVQFLETRPTHQATWDYLENWAGGGSAAGLLGRVIQPRSRSVSDWLQSLPTPVAWSPLGTELLLSMGLDLRRMADDRTARNEASYRPTGVSQDGTTTAHDDADFAVELVRLMEPGGTTGAFDVLDSFLLRRAVELAFEAGTNTAPAADVAGFGAAVTAMVNDNIDSEALREQFSQFMTREAQGEDPGPVREAMRTDSHHAPGYDLQVLGRSMLLLRVATGAVRELLATSGLELDSLRFWWAGEGARHGFWDSAPPTIDSSELWLDVAEALVDIDVWIEGGDPSRQSLMESCAYPLSQATGLARVTLMGLAS
jgi:hypothetical protein